jgi:predicted sulfurtransferase
MIAEVIIKVEHPIAGTLYKKNRYEWIEGTFQEAMDKHIETEDGFVHICFLSKATKEEFENQNV